MKQTQCERLFGAMLRVSGLTVQEPMTASHCACFSTVCRLTWFDVASGNNNAAALARGLTSGAIDSIATRIAKTW